MLLAFLLLLENPNYTTVAYVPCVSTGACETAIDETVSAGIFAVHEISAVAVASLLLLLEILLLPAFLE
jgi:hypothetical protein